MPKVGIELTDIQVRRLKWGIVTSGPNKGKPRPTLHTVGGVGGLYLQCSPPAPGNKTFARSWILKTPVGNDRPELGLGPYPEITLSAARNKARVIKEGIRQGIDPRVAKKAARSALLAAQAKSVTFRTVCENFAAKKAKEYKTLKQAKKLQSQLESYVYPVLGNMVVSDIERAHIIKLLAPIWDNKTETATRLRAIVERILDMAGAEGLRTGDTPPAGKET